MFQRGLIDIIGLALFWGPSFLFNKIALVDLDPITLVSLRVGLAGLLLWLFFRLRGVSFSISDLSFKRACILGFFNNGFPFVCFSCSLFYIPTSLSALLNGTMPVISIVLARFFLQEPFTWNKVSGLLLGLLGFAVLFIPSLLGSEQGFSMIGIALGLLGALSYAIGVIYTRKRGLSIDPRVMIVYQLLTSLLYLVPLALVFESPLKDIPAASLATWSAILAVAILGTALAFLLYYRILAKQGVAAVAMVTYLLPIVGTILGVLFLHESLHPLFIIAAACILAGVVLVNKKNA
ncbi:MAG: DMT family transporter [Gammaproteobacteria bacterium]|nr:DMT family transporter [Gammaproteobacteria bacterium]MBP9729251.1 DMT family transporter [Gammaproteobacteria bacterium]